MSKRGAIGIDIGGTKTLAALFSETYDVVEEIKIKTQPEKGEKNFTKNLTDAIQSIIDKAKKKNLLVADIGVGCAGSPDNEKGAMKACLNIPFLKGYPLRSRLSKITGANVYLANDVGAGLYGEQQLGAAVGCKNVIGVFIGTGIGGAVIIDGHLYSGAKGRAGNIGHYLIHPVGSVADYEREGVLDNIASRTAIAGEAAILASKQAAPHLMESVGTNVADIKSADLADAIQKGDKSIEQLVRSRSRIVGIALSNIVDFLNPEMVVLGGGLVEALPTLICQEVKEGIESNSTDEAREGLRVVVAKLKGHAVTTGAAKLAVDLLP